MLGAFLKAIPFVFGSLFMGSEDDYLTYEQFGAKGDGVTDDLPAIIATHEAANEKGLPVRAADGKTYYIGNAIGTAVVRTDVDFGTAKFIIDDSDVGLENREHYLNRPRSNGDPHGQMAMMWLCCTLLK